MTATSGDYDWGEGARTGFAAWREKEMAFVAELVATQNEALETAMTERFAWLNGETDTLEENSATSY